MTARCVGSRWIPSLSLRTASSGGSQAWPPSVPFRATRRAALRRHLDVKSVPASPCPFWSLSSGYSMFIRFVPQTALSPQTLGPLRPGALGIRSRGHWVGLRQKGGPGLVGAPGALICLEGGQTAVATRDQVGWARHVRTSCRLCRHWGQVTSGAPWTDSGALDVR